MPRSPEDQALMAAVRGQRLIADCERGRLPARLMLWLWLSLQKQAKNWRWN